MTIEQFETNGDCKRYTLDGFCDYPMKTRSLFWDEVVIEAPTKPLPDIAVDTKVIVWNSISPKLNRHFSHFNSSGKMVCFVNGMTSWTTVQATEWDYWELAE